MRSNVRLILAISSICVLLESSPAAAQATFETHVAPEFAEEDLSRHKGDPPVIRNVGFVASNILCVEIREFKHIWGKLLSYEALPGDEIEGHEEHEGWDSTVYPSILPIVPSRC